MKQVLTGRAGVALAVAAVLLAACGGDDRAATGEGAEQPASAAIGSVRVVTPNQISLQWMSFWVALGAGYFEDEGLSIEVVSPPAPPGAAQFIVSGKADVGVLPPPMYLGLIGDGEPVVVFANLLRNDPINLVVREEVAEERGLSADLPLSERLQSMSGLKVGVAPGPPARLRLLFETVGMDADRDIEMVILHGEEQNPAFARGEVDALYAHTPYLERALVQQGAVTIVDQIGGEVPELSDFVRHALVAGADYARANPDVLVALTRAVHRAQQLIHTDPEATAEALRSAGLEQFPEPEELETAIRVYEPAIPETPEVSVEGMRRNIGLFPAHRVLPDLSTEDLEAHVDEEIAREAMLGAP